MSSGKQCVDIVYVTPRQPGKKSFKYVPKPKTYKIPDVSLSATIEQLLLQQQPEEKRYMNKSNTSAFYFRKDEKDALFICTAPTTGHVFKHSGEDMTRLTVASVNAALGTFVSKIVFVANTWQEDVVKEMDRHFKIHQPPTGSNPVNGWHSIGGMNPSTWPSLVKQTFDINCDLMVRTHHCPYL